jgi:tRNA A-37 threonylcarbamoyl transferase component Bud32
MAVESQVPAFRIVSRALDPGFLDLPWQQPLDEWSAAYLVSLERGISRHVVRFVEVAGTYYALKELPENLAEREYRLLGYLGRENVPAVEPIGIVTQRSTPPGAELEAILITRYLEFSLPFRTLLSRRVAPEETLAVALAGLLVRLHLTGFFWGDCSLSNTLFRRDAGSLAAYLVDVETGEVRDRLSDGQRHHDLEIAFENLSYEFYDVAAQLGNDVEEPSALADLVCTGYERLWNELTEEEVFGLEERGRLRARLEELHELGFDVDEIEIARTADGYRLRLPAAGMESGYHRRRLLRLTGLDAQENQARRLLTDIDAFREALLRSGEQVVSDPAVAGRWLSDIFEPAVAAIPPELHGKRDAAELFHELLEHRWSLSERAGEEVPLAEALDSYIENVLRPQPDERTALLRPAGS